MHTLPLDTLPLPIEPSVRLTGADLRRAEPLQRVLLRPLEHPSIDAWRGAVNEALTAAMGGDSAMFQLDSPGLTRHFSEELNPAPLQAYAAEFMPDLARTKQVYRRALRLAAGNRFTLWKDHLEWLYASDYFQEVVTKLRAFDTLWASAPVEGSPYPAMLHTYHDRPDGGRRFGEEEVQLMRLIQPALEAGVQTVRRVFHARSGLAATIDQLEAAVFAFGLDGRLLHRNPPASALAEAPGGDELSAQAARCARGFARPESLVDPGSVRRRLRTPKGRFELTASLLPPGMLQLSPTVLVTATNRSERLPTRAEVRERFGLTRRQAEVALLLAQRLSNTEIAERLFISPHTALRHTEAVMAKLRLSDRRLVADRLRSPENLRLARAG